MGVDKEVDLLNILRGGPSKAPGLRIVKVSTAAPYATTFVFEGSTLALDIDIFEVTTNCYPLLVDDRLLAYPLVNATGLGQRWALIGKLNDGPVYMGTMQSSTSVLLDWAGAAVEVIAPPGIEVGKRVSVMPTWNGGIKYVVLNQY